MKTKTPKYVMQPLAITMALTIGKVGAAIMLFDLWNYFPNSTQEYQGKSVLILPDEELGKRIGLSFDRARRAKKFLVKNGYIKTWIKKNSKYYPGKTVTHIYIPDEVMTLVEKLKNGTAQICTVGNEQDCISQIVPGCTLPIYIKEKSKINAPSPVITKAEQVDYATTQITELKKGFFYE